MYSFYIIAVKYNLNIYRFQVMFWCSALFLCADLKWPRRSCVEMIFQTLQIEPNLILYLVLLYALLLYLSFDFITLIDVQSLVLYFYQFGIFIILFHNLVYEISLEDSILGHQTCLSKISLFYFIHFVKA